MKPKLFLIFIALGLYGLLLAQNEDSSKSSGIIKKTGPVIKNLKDIQARIVLKPDSSILKYSIHAIKNIPVGETCYFWKILPTKEIYNLGKTEYDFSIPDPETSVLINSIDGRFGILSKSDMIEINNAVPGSFGKDIIKFANKEFLYLIGLETSLNIYEIQPGLTPFQITFTLIAKCGFKNKNDISQYPDTLYEGTIKMDFNFEYKNGKLSIIDNERN